MPKASQNPMKRELQILLSQNGRRLDWVVQNFGLSRVHFDKKIKDNSFTEEEWRRIKDIIVSGMKSKYLKNPNYQPRPRRARRHLNNKRYV